MRSTARRSSTARSNGLGAPIGSHLTPNDPGYVDLTGQYPHDPAKAKALLAEAGVKTPLSVTLTLPPPAYARKGGEIIAARAGRGRHPGEDRERRMGAVAVQRLHQQELRSDDHQPRRAARHRHLRQSRAITSSTTTRISRRSSRAGTPRPISPPTSRRWSTRSSKLADDSVNGFLFQLPNVVVADAKLKGVWKNAPIFANDLGDVLEIGVAAK